LSISTHTVILGPYCWPKWALLLVFRSGLGPSASYIRTLLSTFHPWFPPKPTGQVGPTQVSPLDLLSRWPLFVENISQERCFPRLRLRVPQVRDRFPGAPALEEVLQFKIHGAPTAWMLSLEWILYANLCNNFSLVCIILFYIVLFNKKIPTVHKVHPFKYFVLLIYTHMLCVLVANSKRPLVPLFSLGYQVLNPKSFLLRSMYILSHAINAKYLSCCILSQKNLCMCDSILLKTVLDSICVPVTYVGKATNKLLDKINHPAWNSLCNF
jgi:hypothetical protein